MTAAITRITRDEAKEQARERLSEVLTEAVPGFRPERAFRCLNPGHEDRHPSMRYMSRTNTVRCFSCGWSGDVFDVVGAVYGLSGGDLFAKVYDMLDIAVGRGRTPRRKILASPKPAPGSIEELRALIYPPGWNDPEPKAALPMPLQVIAEVESGLVGRLARNPEIMALCAECGLQGWHFDDEELGDFYNALSRKDSLRDYNVEFVEWLTARAAPLHMMRKLARFIVAEGRRRWLDVGFTMAHTHFQNQEPVDEVAANLLRIVGHISGERYAFPAAKSVSEWANNIFSRYRDGESPVALLAEWNSEGR